MKKFLLLGIALIVSASIVAQKIHLKPGIQSAKPVTEQKIGIEPEKVGGFSPFTTSPSKTKMKGIVDVITLGTSANAFGYGYGGGQKTQVWADDSLGTLINIHRMGPGATPPSFSGYLGVDKAINQGASSTDWTINHQIYSATLNNGGSYYLDAARYPQGAIYNPAGNTDPDNSYVVYFSANLSNTVSSWGGYSYGRSSFNTAQQDDTTKRMFWYNPPPFSYIPDGFTLTHTGHTLMTDMDQEWAGTTFVGYKDDLILGYGSWNETTSDFDYEFSTIPMPTTDSQRPSNQRIAASPDGNDIWIVVLSNNGGAVQIGDSANYYPILLKSNDGGITWSDPLAIQLDGPDGIDGVKNGLSDYRLEQLYGAPIPSRDEIPYTTAFDCDIVVDKWGNPHIGVVIGISAGDYSIATGDSNCMVFDIYTTDGGNTWQGQKMGDLKTFRGEWVATGSTPLTEDNRTNIAISETGDYVFVTWLDTHVDGVTDNIQPDVFARGFNLLENKITSVDGNDISNNVTFLSELYQQACFQVTSHYVFSKTGGGHIIPICTELLTNEDAGLPVTFKYISNFSYMPADYTIASTNPPFPVGINDNKKELTLNATVSPNPVQDIATLTVNLKQGGNLNIEITSMTGQKVMSFDKGFVVSGTQQFSIDASNLQAGVYFCTIKLNDQKFTNKMVVR
ncbi:MAG: T9SS type A sorting domain-containing protein [bacterium]